MECEDDSDNNGNWGSQNISKCLVKGQEDLEIRGQVETIQTIALLGLDGILRRVLETWEDLLSLKLHWKTIC